MVWIGNLTAHTRPVLHDSPWHLTICRHRRLIDNTWPLGNISFRNHLTNCFIIVLYLVDIQNQIRVLLLVNDAQWWSDTGLSCGTVRQMIDRIGEYRALEGGAKIGREGASSDWTRLQRLQTLDQQLFSTLCAESVSVAVAVDAFQGTANGIAGGLDVGEVVVASVSKVDVASFHNLRNCSSRHADLALNMSV